MPTININIIPGEQPVFNNTPDCGKVRTVRGDPLNTRDCTELEEQLDDLQEQHNKLTEDLNTMANKATELAEALREAGITNLTLDGTTLTVHTGGGDKSVDLAPILPVIGKDLFLKNVERNDNKIVFTVGAKDNTDNDTQFEVDVSDLLPVKTGNSITGDGTTNNKLDVKLDTAEDNLLEITESGLKLSKDKIKELTSSDTGSCEDCLANIPEKAFDSGSAIVAFDRDGNLYKFRQSENYFKDGSLEMSVTKSDLKDDGNTEHTISIKVVNTRDVAIPTATLSLSSANDITGLTVTNAGTATAAISGDDVTITNIPAYGEVEMTASVISNQSSYIAGDLVVEGDVAPKNNNITVRLDTKPQPPATTNVYTEECPLISVKYGDKVLQQSKQEDKAFLGGASIYYSDDVFINTVDKVGLNGVSLSVEGGSSVRVYVVGNTDETYDPSRFSGVAIIKEVAENTYEHWLSPADDPEQATDSDYTFDGSTLTFTANKRAAVIFVRPPSETCKWQRYIISTKLPNTTVTVTNSHIGVTGLDSDKYSYQVITNEVDISTAEYPRMFKDVPLVETAPFKTDVTGARYLDHREAYWQSKKDAETYLVDSTLNINSRLIVKLPQGGAFNFSIDAGNVLPEQQGAVATKSDGNVSVLATAKPTDSVYTDRVDIIIEE